jgi:hypothetical protein
MHLSTSPLSAAVLTAASALVAVTVASGATFENCTDVLFNNNRAVDGE